MCLQYYYLHVFFVKGALITVKYILYWQKVTAHARGSVISLHWSNAAIGRDGGGRDTSRARLARNAPSASKCRVCECRVTRGSCRVHPNRIGVHKLAWPNGHWFHVNINNSCNFVVAKQSRSIVQKKSNISYINISIIKINYIRCQRLKYHF